jgi:TonB-dependent receptor
MREYYCFKKNGAMPAIFKSKGIRLFGAFLLLLIISSQLYAGGELKGLVADQLTKEALIGANIILKGTSYGTTTDINGVYDFRKQIPEGEYIVQCSYIGYLTKELPVVIKNDDVVLIDFALEFDAVMGAEIVITAQMKGQVAAINQQLNSEKIVNVVSEEKIQELPDANAAEALGRLPGVALTRVGGEANKIVLRGLDSKLTTVTIDGVKLSATDADSRGIDLSAISQGSLAGIELFKAITADMEAESVGGSVNFVTKGAPEKRVLQFDLHNYYGAMDNTFKQYNFSGRYSDRFLDNKLGIQLNANIESRNRSSEKVETLYGGELPDENNLFTKYHFRYGEVFYSPEERKRFGGGIILDYKLKNTDYLKLSTRFNKTERDFSELSRNYSHTSHDALITYKIRSREMSVGMLNASLQGQHTFTSWQINWNASYTSSLSEIPYDYQMEFHEPSTFDENGQVVSGMGPMNIDPANATFEDIIPYAINNFERSFLYYANNRTENNDDNEKTFFVDIKKSYSLWKLSGEVKTGAKYRSHYHEKINDYSFAPYYSGTVLKQTYQLPDGTIENKDFEGYGFSEYGNGYSGLIPFTSFIIDENRNVFNNYSLYPIIDNKQVRNWHDLNINGIDQNNLLKEYRVSYEEKDQQYSLVENIAAGYLMNTLNYGSLLTFIAGVRLESDRHKYMTYVTDEKSIDEYTVFRDTTASYSEIIALPNLHLIVRPTNFLNIRLASYKAISRPDFNTRLPLYLTSIALSGSVPEPFVILGNPNLKNASAWNYEANVQIYGNTIGLVSVSAFYKEIKDEVKYLNKIRVTEKAFTDSIGIVFKGDELPFKSFELTYPYNSDKPTKVWGLEFEHQANFRFLPGLLKNFVLDYNFSLVKSETYETLIETKRDSVLNPFFGFYTYTDKQVPVEKKTSLKNSPELFGNIALGYDYKGFSIRASYFYQDEYYLNISGDRKTDLLQASYGRFDLALKQKCTKNISVGLNVNNLNNAWEQKYRKDQTTGYQFIRSRYSYGTSADVWLRITL